MNSGESFPDIGVGVCAYGVQAIANESKQHMEKEFILIFYVK